MVTRGLISAITEDTPQQAVDDPVLDTNTYVESGTSGHLDLYTFQDLPSGVTSVPGVMLRVTGSAAAGSRGLLLKLRNGVDTITSTVRTFVFGNWSTRYHIAERAPDGSAWSKASVDATEAGIEVQ